MKQAPVGGAQTQAQTTPTPQPRGQRVHHHDAQPHWRNRQETGADANDLMLKSLASRAQIHFPYLIAIKQSWVPDPGPGRTHPIGWCASPNRLCREVIKVDRTRANLLI